MESLPTRLGGELLQYIPTLLWLAVALVPSMASASGARYAVKAAPGEIVLLRNVATRPADRQPVSPGMALLVDPSPRQQIASALGLSSGDLSDADYANLSASSPAGGNSQSTTVGSAIHNAIDNTLGSGGGSGGNAVAGNGVSNAISGPVGAVGDTTRGIGDQITGALSQIPMPTGNGH